MTHSLQRPSTVFQPRVLVEIISSGPLFSFNFKMIQEPWVGIDHTAGVPAEKGAARHLPCQTFHDLFPCTSSPIHVHSNLRIMRSWTVLPCCREPLFEVDYVVFTREYSEHDWDIV
jgi:hypothetical protein